MRKHVKLISLCLIGSLLALGGCTTPPEPVDPGIDHDGLAREGIAPHIWEEPMVDVVEVPPGLDPEGHYYRPTHQEVVEIKQGRWQYYKNKENR